MFVKPQICVRILKKQSHVFTNRVSNDQYVECVEIHLGEKIIVALKPRTGGHCLRLFWRNPAIDFRIPVRLALLWMEWAKEVQKYQGERIRGKESDELVAGKTK